MDLDTLRSLIAQKLADGRLPQDGIPHMSGVPSQGETCDACGRVIEPREFVMSGVGGDQARPVRFHVDCLYLWDSTR